MKKRFLQHSSPSKILGILILGSFLLLFLWAFSASGTIKSAAQGALYPVFKFSGFVGNLIGSSSEAKLAQEKKELEVRNSILEARVRDLEGALNFPHERREGGKIALLSSQAPILPHGTLLVSFADGEGISVGADVIAYGGIYIGEVVERGDRWAQIELISYPGLLSEAWIEKLALSITLEGQGGQNMKFSIPRSVKVEVGDKIISNTTPQYLIGEVEIVEERPTEPLQEIILRLPLNFRNLRYVELVP